MKKTILSKKTWTLALCAFVLSSLLYVACSKDNATVNSDSKGELPQLSEAEKLAMLKKEVESVNTTIYNHLKFRMRSTKPEAYLNEEIREPVMDLIRQTNQKNKGLSTEQILQNGLDEKTIRPIVAQKVFELKEVLESIGAPNSLEAFEKPLLAFEEANYNNKILQEDEIFYINSASAAFRALNKHFDDMKPRASNGESINKGLQTREDCFLGKKTSCYINTLIGAVTGGLTGVVTQKLTKPAGITTFSAGKVGFLVGLVSGIVNIFLDPNCNCSNAAPACFVLEFFHPIIDGNSTCNPNIGFAVSGTGVLPTSFKWSAFRVLSSGQEVAISDVQNKTTGGPALAPFPIPNPDETIIIRVEIPACGSAPTVFENTFSINQLLRDPGSVFINGPYSVSLNTTAQYVISGSCLINPNNQYSWNNPSAGTVVGGQNTSVASIKFTTRTCYSYNGWSQSCFPTYVIGRSTNQCSGLQGSNAYSVIVP
jgi:hypothetical protein